MIPSPEDHREFLGSIIAARTNDEARKIRDDFNHRFPTFSESEVWEEPLPLTAKVEPEPYPVDALPEIVRAAVEEVQAFSKAPISLVASSALGALSLAAQALFDVKRAEKLSGPVGLFLLTIADSGERKSTCDTFFLKAIREFQKEQVETAKPKLAKYRAELAAWEAKRDGFLDAIRKDSRQDKETETKEKALHELEIEKPTPPRIPQLLRGDETPENLAWALANEWPSAGIMSSEAGAILGAHGMGKDSIMRNLALYNILWDGGSLSIGRRSSESFTVQGARLSVGLQVQEATLRSFFDRSGGLARGTGFLARFLLAWPESTQGYRHFSEAPADWPKLAAFNRRISEILNQPVAIDEESLLQELLLMGLWEDFLELGDLRAVAAGGGSNFTAEENGAWNRKYPAAYATLVSLFSQSNGLPQALGWAIMREESRFRPEVVSAANAIGLMQIIPPTGFEIARALGREGFDPQDLYRPVVNIEYGIRYLAMNLARFSGDLIRTIASYNAGPEAVERWTKARPNREWDEFVEEIPYAETQEYVRKVLRSFYLYRVIYGPSGG